MGLSERIAIVGLGGIFPGAMDAAQLWEHVKARRSMSREVPAGRWPLAVKDVFAAKGPGRGGGGGGGG